MANKLTSTIIFLKESTILTRTWLGSEVDVSEVVFTIDGVGSGTARLKNNFDKNQRV